MSKSSTPHHPLPARCTRAPYLPWPCFKWSALPCPAAHLSAPPKHPHFATFAQVSRQVLHVLAAARCHLPRNPERHERAGQRGAAPPAARQPGDGGVLPAQSRQQAGLPGGQGAAGGCVTARAEEVWGVRGVAQAAWPPSRRDGRKHTTASSLHRRRAFNTFHGAAAPARRWARSTACWSSWGASPTRRGATSLAWQPATSSGPGPPRRQGPLGVHARERGPCVQHHRWLRWGNVCRVRAGSQPGLRAGRHLLGWGCSHALQIAVVGPIGDEYGEQARVLLDKGGWGRKRHSECKRRQSLPSPKTLSAGRVASQAHAQLSRVPGLASLLAACTENNQPRALPLQWQRSSRAASGTAPDSTLPAQKRSS